jgi:hypothetical protein
MLFSLMIFGATMVPAASTNAVVVSALLIMLAASTVMFRVLSERSTSHRRRIELAEWARGEGWDFSDALPPVFDRLPGLEAGTALRDLEHPAWAAQLGSWHLLVRQIEAEWRQAALRPTGATTSALDLFPLNAFPRYDGVRFTVLAADAAAAETLWRSSAGALLPPDVGLLLYGHYLVLDFSARPFDSIELNRMRTVAEQIAARLPMQRV